LKRLYILIYIILRLINPYKATKRHLKKMPYLYEENLVKSYTERGIENACRYLDNAQLNEDLATLYSATGGMSHAEALDWLDQNSQKFSNDTLLLHEGEIDPHTPKKGLIICTEPFNEIRYFNEFLLEANKVLSDGGTLSLCGETSGMRRERIRLQNPPLISKFKILYDYLWGRVIAKLALTRHFYMRVTDGRNRNFPRVEVLGRIAKAGFDICGDEIVNGVYYIAAVRRRDPITTPPKYGLFVRLPRKGENGKMIGVYKLRTMYAYSEFIQDYAFRINGLEKGGKLKNDFRVNLVGSYCRSRFLDELPMFINLFKGDMKFVGVRPLSAHYLSLYTPEMQELHLSVKPGIFPPLYYEYPKPSTLEEIQDSERRYIESYKRHPHRTDWRYFWGMVRNIIFHHERSH